MLVSTTISARVYLSGYQDIYPSNGYLVEQDNHIAEVSMEPGVHGLAHAANLIQRRCMLVWPAEVQDLMGYSTSRRRLKRCAIRTSPNH